MNLGKAEVGLDSDKWNSFSVSLILYHYDSDMSMHMLFIINSKWVSTSIKTKLKVNL